MKTCPIEPEAVLIDLDGTLADSLTAMRDVYQMFLGEFHIQGTDTEFASLNGPPLAEVVRRLMVAHQLTHDAKWLTKRYSEIVDRVYDGVSPSIGARQLLAVAKKHDCRVAIVTSNSSNRTSSWLSRVGLAEFVDFIIAGEQVKYGKPDPEPYSLAIRMVNGPVERMIAIEDSTQGAASAVGAGLYTYLVTPHCSESSAVSKAIQVSSLGQITVDVWGP